MGKSSTLATLHITLSIASLMHQALPLFSPPPPCLWQQLGNGSCDPPWASSTLTNDDNILNWSGSPISGTQTQISGSSPVKRSPGTVPLLPNLNQQRSRENGRAWTAAALTPLHLCQATISLSVSVSVWVSLSLYALLSLPLSVFLTDLII